MNKLSGFLELHKQGHKIVCLTAYTTPMAQSLAPHVDLLLVGDSMGTAIYGMDSTQGVSMEMMCAHGAAVIRGASDVPVIIDLPYGSYESAPAHASSSAQRIIEETGADGVKLEGGVEMQEHIKAITDAGIAVMGHIGLLPQSAPNEGGYKIKGKSEEQISRLIADAKAVEAAGAFSVVIEGTIDSAAELASAAVSIPTIGIGASGACSGQILVSEDLFGFTHGHRPKFAPDYGDVKGVIDNAAKRYAEEVRSGAFPRAEYLYKKKAS